MLVICHHWVKEMDFFKLTLIRVLDLTHLSVRLQNYFINIESGVKNFITFVAGPQRTKSDGSGSDSSPTTPHKATTLYSSAQGRQKPDLASRFSTVNQRNFFAHHRNYRLSYRSMVILYFLRICIFTETKTSQF